MSVGMAAQLGLVASQPLLILLGVAILLAAKSAVAFGLARLAGQDTRNALRFALALPQGSEFSFVLFGAAVAVGVLTPGLASRATLVIALSMAATPILFAASEHFLIQRLQSRKEPKYDAIEGTAPIIICGFGRVGRSSAASCGWRASRSPPWRKTPARSRRSAASVTRCITATLAARTCSAPRGRRRPRSSSWRSRTWRRRCAVVDMVRRNFPNLKIFARARNRRHAHLLMDRHIAGLVRETFHSSLRLTELVLDAAGVPDAEARRAVKVFQEHDEQALLESHALLRR